MAEHATRTIRTSTDDDRLRITTWTFEDGEDTGHHRHEFDYVVVPVTGGAFEITEPDGGTREMTQEAANAYQGRAGTGGDFAPEPDGASACSSNSDCALLFAGGMLGGCASGDFGRTREDRTTTTCIAGSARGDRQRRPQRVGFQLTDRSGQLRDLAYPLIEPPHSRPAWKPCGDYTPISAPWRQVLVFDRSAYGRMLIDEPHRSHTSRYSDLMDDVRNDMTRFEPFLPRRPGLDSTATQCQPQLVSDLSPRERADAVARMQENSLIVQWVQQCLERRISSIAGRWSGW